MNSEKVIWWILGAIGLTIIGGLLVPRILAVVRGKIYKASNHTTEIDFDNLGPEIVKKDNGGDNR